MSADAYEAVRSRWGWLRRADRTLFRVTGERAVEMLDGLATNDLRALPVGRALWTLFLNPKGRIHADALVLRRETEFWLDVPAVAADSLGGIFRKFLPPRFARAEHVTGSALVGVYGPAAADAVAAATGAPAPAEPLAFTESGSGETARVVVRDDSLGLPGYGVIAPAGSLAPVVSELAARAGAAGGAELDASLFDVLRVEAGRPRQGTDVTEENLVQETGWEADAVSFTKGCYIGQEVVIRIHHRGHPNRHLRGLRFHGELPDPGAPLYSDEKAVGSVTSAVRSPRLGPIGLGYVRREVEPGSQIHLGGPGIDPAAQVVALPFPR